MDEIPGPRCFACDGPYHPASGHCWLEYGVFYCGRCYRIFVRWMAGHLKRKWSGHTFYEAAATSIRAGVWPLEGVRYVSGGG